MKGLFITIDNPNYNLSNFISQWYDVSSYTDIEFIVKCDQNLNQKIEFAMDLNFNIVDTTDIPVISNTTNLLRSIVKTRYVRFTLENILSTPCNLSCQAFYYN